MHLPEVRLNLTQKAFCSFIFSTVYRGGDDLILETTPATLFSLQIHKPTCIHANGPYSCPTKFMRTQLVYTTLIETKQTTYHAI